MDISSPKNLPKITDINFILFHCNIIKGDYVGGSLSKVSYFFPSLFVPIGYKINILHCFTVYFSVTRKSIQEISIRILNAFN